MVFLFCYRFYIDIGRIKLNNVCEVFRFVFSIGNLISVSCDSVAGGGSGRL